jgi:hypothetical protein
MRVRKNPRSAAEKKLEKFHFGMGLTSVLECPVCASENVRVSFSTPPWEPIYRWQGLQRYRCRECRKTFHEPLLPGEDFAPKPARRRRRRALHKERLAVPAWQQKLFEGALFLLLLFFFYAALSVANS